MPQGDRRARQPGLLARFFCFAPKAGARVGVQPGSSEIERAKRQREKDASQAALAAQATGAPAVAGLPSTPSSAAALAAYLGSALAPAPSGFGSTDASLPLTSSPCDTSSLGSAGPSGSGGGCAASSLDEGYDADSDCPPSEECTPRRFRSALRHMPVETDGHATAVTSASAAAHGGVEAGMLDAAPGLSGPALADTVNPFDQQSPCSSTSRTSRRGAHVMTGQAAAQEADAAESAAAWSASAPGQSPHADSQPPSSRASRSSFAASGSISLYHFLGGASRRSARSVRSLGSRRPAATTSAAEPEAAASLADEAGDVAVVAESSPLGVPLPRKASARAASAPLGAPGTVTRRLSEIQGGHYTSLEKLRQQCGSFDEPPADLLSLLARRVFASRSSLLQRLRSEGQLSDLQAANDSRQHTPSELTLASPRSPLPPPPQQQQQQHTDGVNAEEAALPQLQQLPRIRTRPVARGGTASSGSSSGR